MRQFMMMRFCQSLSLSLSHHFCLCECSSWCCMNVFCLLFRYYFVCVRSFLLLSSFQCTISCVLPNSFSSFSPLRLTCIEHSKSLGRVFLRCHISPEFHRRHSSSSIHIHTSIIHIDISLCCMCMSCSWVHSHPPLLSLLLLSLSLSVSDETPSLLSLG